MNICKNRAFEVLERLSFPRIAGTPGEMEAAELLKAECEKYGVPAVIEAFEIDMPEIHEAKLTVNGEEINCIGIGKSGVTPDEGVCGPLLYVEDGLEANMLDAEGKILLLTGMAKPEVLERMRKSGALGYIACHGSLYDPVEMIPELRTRNERRKPDEKDNFPGLVQTVAIGMGAFRISAGVQGNILDSVYIHAVVQTAAGAAAAGIFQFCPFQHINGSFCGLLCGGGLPSLPGYGGNCSPPDTHRNRPELQRTLFPQWT